MINLLERLLQDNTPLCAFCGADTKHGKGTGKLATHHSSEFDALCEQCCKEYELYMAFNGDYKSEITAYLEGQLINQDIAAIFEAWWVEREAEKEDENEEF
jgi:hypothetical protein